MDRSEGTREWLLTLKSTFLWCWQCPNMSSRGHLHSGEYYTVATALCATNAQVFWYVQCFSDAIRRKHSISGRVRGKYLVYSVRSHCQCCWEGQLYCEIGLHLIRCGWENALQMYRPPLSANASFLHGSPWESLRGQTLEAGVPPNLTLHVLGTTNGMPRSKRCMWGEKRYFLILGSCKRKLAARKVGWSRLVAEALVKRAQAKETRGPHICAQTYFFRSLP